MTTGTGDTEEDGDGQCDMMDGLYSLVNYVRGVEDEAVVELKTRRRISLTVDGDPPLLFAVSR